MYQIVEEENIMTQMTEEENPSVGALKYFHSTKVKFTKRQL